HSGVLHAGSVIDHQTRGFDVSGHLCDLKLYALEFRERLAKLLSLLRVPGRVLPRSTRNPQHLSRNPDTAFIQSFNGYLVTFTDFTENVLARHAAIFPNQLTGGRRPNAELVFLLAHRESGKVFFD